MASDTSRLPAPDPRAYRAARLFEDKLALVARGVKLLPNLTARNAAGERLRLQAQLERGEMPVANFEYPEAKSCRDQLRYLDSLRMLALNVPGAPLYLTKIDELELDLLLLANLGDRRRVRPLAARRFGRGDQRVDTGTPEGSVRLSDYARRLLRTRPRREERLDIPSDAQDGSPCLRALVESIAQAAGLDVNVRVEPNLTAGAATGDKTVFLADRHFGPREALRLAVHEVLGHLTSAANGRTQPLRIMEWGTGFAFADQEGVALSVEAAFGLLDRGRLRSLAGRVLATDSMHEGATFGETASLLFKEHGFAASESIAIAERAHRGGGVARDCGYLLGYLRVRAALASGETSLDELRSGRISIAALPEVRRLVAQGLLRPAFYRPNFSRSFFSTNSGTMPWRSPPSTAASLISVELT
ncbi:MAG TPA: tyrosine/phenylalanine carboxypeptidase domain-containing protein [Polyangiales bacterium]|nr:tyrosine/phenylalanine carboxypeptidase domain-containing protein [Polyangiales bacterium]